MFFRRPKPQEFTFQQRLDNLKNYKFTVTSVSGGARVTRDGCGAIVKDLGKGDVEIGKAGVLIGNEIGVLVSRGYQMFLRTPSGHEVPAQAAQLHKLHEFDEDLREGLGLTSMFNLALGTTSEAHLYDRVKDRDSANPPRPWERRPV